MPELVTIASETSLLQANLLRSRLEADGIRCFLSGESLASVVGSPSTLANHILIQVQSFDAGQAHLILRELNADTSDVNEDDTWRTRKPGFAMQLARILFTAALMTQIGFLIYGATENWSAGVLAGLLTGGVVLAIAFQRTRRLQQGSHVKR